MVLAKIDGVPQQFQDQHAFLLIVPVVIGKIIAEPSPSTGNCAE
jgi:hypothetical protein